MLLNFLDLHKIENFHIFHIFCRNKSRIVFYRYSRFCTYWFRLVIEFIWESYSLVFSYKYTYKDQIFVLSNRLPVVERCESYCIAWDCELVGGNFGLYMIFIIYQNLTYHKIKSPIFHLVFSKIS